MELLPSEIEQFQKLYKAKFGIVLDDKTARYKLLKLVRQMYRVYRPITQEQLKAYNAKNENEEIINERAAKQI